MSEAMFEFVVTEATAVGCRRCTRRGSRESIGESCRLR
jgi:hypothetical protein